MRENRQTKIRIVLNCEMIREELSNQIVENLEVYFQRETFENLEATNESREYEISMNTIQERLQNFNRRGSNWRFQRVISLDIHLTEFNPLGGSSFIKTPEFIAKKKAVINLENEDFLILLKKIHKESQKY